MTFRQGLLLAGFDESLREDAGWAAAGWLIDFRRIAKRQSLPIECMYDDVSIWCIVLSPGDRWCSVVYARIEQQRDTPRMEQR